MNPTYDFRGKVAFVTGASAGIGLAAAKGFAEAGAAVVLADINGDAVESAAAEIAAAAHQVIGVTCDVSGDAQVAALIAQAVATYGRLDMGVQQCRDRRTLRHIHRRNYRGVRRCECGKSARHLVVHAARDQSDGEAGRRAIVNCSSLGDLVGQAGRAAYHGTKHGVLGLTKSVGVEYASRGVRVNAVCPGLVDTPMLGSLKETSPEAMEQVLREQPISRLGRPEEIAAAVLWLCSHAASFVAGAALSVDGGFVAH